MYSKNRSENHLRRERNKVNEIGIITIQLNNQIDLFNLFIMNVIYCLINDDLLTLLK